MKKMTLLVMLVLMFAWSGAGLAAQNPPAKPPAQPPGQPPTQPQVQKPAPRRVPAPARGSVTFFITDPQGKGVDGATVAMTGPANREGETNRDGVVTLQNLRAGAYRVRVEAEEFIPLERDITMRSGLEVEMTLNPAPEPPAPQTPALPAPAAPSGSPTAIPPDPNAVLQLSSVVEFFAKNQLGRNEPRDETVVGSAPEATSSLLQVRTTFEGRSHEAADEVLYVINGKAEINSKGRVYPVETGSLVVIPRGVSYSIANRGREPLWALAVRAGGK